MISALHRYTFASDTLTNTLLLVDTLRLFSRLPSSLGTRAARALRRVVSTEAVEAYLWLAKAVSTRRTYQEGVEGWEGGWVGGWVGGCNTAGA
jgi:hypothetical protein